MKTDTKRETGTKWGTGYATYYSDTLPAGNGWEGRVVRRNNAETKKPLSRFDIQWKQIKPGDMLIIRVTETTWTDEAHCAGTETIQLIVPASVLGQWFSSVLEATK